MDIDKSSILYSIIDSYKDLINDDDELVIKLNNNDLEWSELDFNNFTGVMRSNYDEIIEDDVLECNSNEDYLYITGIPNINKYCMINYIDNKESKWIKNKILNTNDITNELDIDISISHIKKIIIDKPTEWDNLSKKYNIRRNIRYNTKKFDYIVSIYKNNNEEFYTLKHSNIFKEKQKYNFYIIIKENLTTLEIIQSIIKTIQSITLSSVLLTKKQQKDILNDYFKLVKNDFDEKELKYSKDIPLITPKPITLERINIIDPKTYGALSILSEYTVTEKADGERILVYINSKGYLYFINNSYRIEYSGIRVKEGGYNTIIDGEFILCNKRIDNSNKNIYAAFDIYYLNGKSIMSHPLINEEDKIKSRYELLKSFENLIIKDENNLEFIVKKHRYSKDILNDCNDILKTNKEYPYDIDGLIFTPAKLSVFSYYANMPLSKIPINSKWDRVFKWKPPEQNSIDFLIEEGKIIIKNGYKYRELHLKVAIDISRWTDLDIIESLKIRYLKQIKTFNTSSYVTALFNPELNYKEGVNICHIKLENNGDINTEDGDKIDNKSIVEFKYINDEKIFISERWVPIRIREDKTRLYKKNIIAKTANDHSVANNIWNSIHYPISKSMITGVEKYDYDDDINNLNSDDIYYSRNINRINQLSYDMLQFHNLGIKNSLYNKYRKGSLLELCCGEGGDIPRWFGYDFVLGIDFVKKNIYNPRSGCYKRMLNYLKQRNIKGYLPNMVFIAGDCSKNIKNGDCSKTIDDEESYNILNKVMNKNRNNEIYLRHIAGKGSDGFDNVSCMFAIHYFFENEEKLNGFLNNVSSNLKKGGIFFCTFMNGDKVVKEIEKNNGDFIEGRKLEKYYDNGGTPIWAIIRKYEKDEENLYNKKINVFIENTQKLIPEYLVSFDLLLDKAKEFGLELIESESFDESLNRIKKEEIDASLLKSINNLENDEVLKKFSFLNMYASFRKI